MELTRGNRGRIFVAFLLCAVVAYVGVIIFQGPFWVAAILLAAKAESPRWLLFLTSVSGAVGGSLTGPVTMIVLVLCYYDLRIRKEGFDLQYKMAALGEQPPPTAPTVSLG